MWKKYILFEVQWDVDLKEKVNIEGIHLKIIAENIYPISISSAGFYFISGLGNWT